MRCGDGTEMRGVLPWTMPGPYRGTSLMYGSCYDIDKKNKSLFLTR